MPELFVGAGSNLDPVRALRRAAADLERLFGALRCSRVYRSSAVGGPAAPRGSPRRGADYLNFAISLSTERGVDSVQEALRAIEAHAGRSRADPAVVALDLDLLLYGTCVDASRRLPRPGSFKAPFVLGPLAELAPELVHPVTGERCLAAWQGAARGDLHDVGPLHSLG